MVYYSVIKNNILLIICNNVNGSQSIKLSNIIKAQK